MSKARYTKTGFKHVHTNTDNKNRKEFITDFCNQIKEALKNTHFMRKYEYETNAIYNYTEQDYKIKKEHNYYMDGFITEYEKINDDGTVHHKIVIEYGERMITDEQKNKTGYNLIIPVK